jgi:hypothetical protein
MGLGSRSGGGGNEGGEWGMAGDGGRRVTLTWRMLRPRNGLETKC